MYINKKQQRPSHHSLMMEADRVFETLDYSSELTRVVAQDDVITFIRRENTNDVLTTEKTKIIEIQTRILFYSIVLLKQIVLKLSIKSMALMLGKS
jgi:hypothetical protein